MQIFAVGVRIPSINLTILTKLFVGMLAVKQAEDSVRIFRIFALILAICPVQSEKSTFQRSSRSFLVEKSLLFYADSTFYATNLDDVKIYRLYELCHSNGLVSCRLY